MSTAISSLGSSNSSGTTTLANPNAQLNTSDFITMMITQLENQDPMNPDQSKDLLSQMSEIGQLQSSNQLQSTLSTMMLQNQISSAGNLIGKHVTGLADDNTAVNGVVNSVQVVDGNVNLQLDTGASLQLSKVTSVSPAATVTPTATPTATNTTSQGFLSGLLSSVL